MDDAVLVTLLLWAVAVIVLTSTFPERWDVTAFLQWLRSRHRSDAD